MNMNSQKLDFITTDEYTADDVKRVQFTSVELLKKIVEIFHKHNIEYIVAHGTLLGLIRHEGKFIPWDDDCDLFVFDWCYSRAIEILRRELPENMIVHNRRTDPIYWCKWTKIRDAHSYTEETLWKIDSKFKYHGICIDLLRATPSTNGEYRELVFKRKLHKRRKWVAKKRKKRISLFKKIRWRIGDLYYAFAHLLHKIICLCDKKKIIIANKDTVIEATFKTKDVFPLQYYNFEGLRVLGPKNPDGVLKSLYGDYMKIPNIERISREQHASIWDTEKNYTEYIEKSPSLPAKYVL